jgi:zinc transport system substrate-binding protein
MESAMYFGDSDNFGDSALNCDLPSRLFGTAIAGQLSALSPKLSLLPKFIAATFLLASTALAHAESPKVVASFKPVHSLVSAVMQGVGDPYLMVKGASSPHTYAMTPSDAEALQNADAIFWIGHEFETFLDKPIDALSGKSAVVSFEETAGITKLPLREGGAFDAHEHEGEAAHEHKGDAAHSEEAGHEEHDLHIWMDPQNAKIMVGEIEKTLSAKDPANAEVYKANAGKANAALDALDAELAASLATVKGRPFITFHDAFQYFEKRYGVEASGSITVNPDTAPGAERVAELQAKMKSLNAACVFAEPNFEPKIISTVIEGSNAKTGTLDPEASALTEGPDLYFQSLREIAANMKSCLS